jgi:hypothetical protein
MSRSQTVWSGNPAEFGTPVRCAILVRPNPGQAPVRRGYSGQGAM